jgi:hypothetical protein
MTKKINLLLIIILFTLTACNNQSQIIDESSSKIAKAPLEMNSTDMPKTVKMSENTNTFQTNPINRKVTKHAELKIETKNFQKTIKELEQSISDYKGYIESNHISGVSIEKSNIKQEGKSAIYTIRIPSNQLNNYLENVNQYGNIISKSIFTEDLSNQYIDTEMRVKSLKIQEERFLTLLKKSGSLKEIIELEKELSRVRFEIESLTSTIKNYDSMINYSTINLSVIEVSTITDTTPPKTVSDRISTTFKHNIESISNGFKNMTVFLVGNSLLIAFWIIILTTCYLITRRAIHKYTKIKEI